ncbi:hypothetical protein RVX_R27390 [Nitratidesulfovibrio sp. HK-II]|uniref:hypothetical protein n=1 Tax=Nitratidesulfovibrio sp. HK-II TaxID=2009266 RepID=UPI003A7047A9
MEILHYDRVTRELLGQGVADPDPLTDGAWLIPAHAVAAADAPLPPTRDGYARVLNATGDGWEYVEDHRGKEGWLPGGAPHVVVDLGPLPEGWSEVEPPQPLASVVAAKQGQIRDGAEAVLAPMKAEYGPTEIASWDQQYEEANALEGNPDAPAPLVRAIAAARGMDAAALAARIRANRAAWVSISGHVVGQRLAYQDALDAAAALSDEGEARAAIAAIVPVYTLPEAANA